MCNCWRLNGWFLPPSLECCLLFLLLLLLLRLVVASPSSGSLSAASSDDRPLLSSPFFSFPLFSSSFMRNQTIPSSSSSFSSSSSSADPFTLPASDNRPPHKDHSFHYPFSSSTNGSSLSVLTGLSSGGNLTKPTNLHFTDQHIPIIRHDDPTTTHSNNKAKFGNRNNGLETLFFANVEGGMRLSGDHGPKNWHTNKQRLGQIVKDESYNNNKQTTDKHNNQLQVLQPHQIGGDQTSRFDKSPGRRPHTKKNDGLILTSLNQKKVHVTKTRLKEINKSRQIRPPSLLLYPPMDSTRRKGINRENKRGINRKDDPRKKNGIKKRSRFIAVYYSETPENNSDYTTTNAPNLLGNLFKNNHKFKQPFTEMHSGRSAMYRRLAVLPTLRVSGTYLPLLDMEIFDIEEEEENHGTGAEGHHWEKAPLLPRKLQIHNVTQEEKGVLFVDEDHQVQFITGDNRIRDEGTNNHIAAQVTYIKEILTSNSRVLLDSLTSDQLRELALMVTVPDLAMSLGGKECASFVAGARHQADVDEFRRTLKNTTKRQLIKLFSGVSGKQWSGCLKEVNPVYFEQFARSVMETSRDTALSSGMQELRGGAPRRRMEPTDSRGTTLSSTGRGEAATTPSWSGSSFIRTAASILDVAASLASSPRQAVPATSSPTKLPTIVSLPPRPTHTTQETKALASLLRNDEHLSRQWYLFDPEPPGAPASSEFINTRPYAFDIEALEAWEIYRPKVPTITVGLIDSGVQVSHPDIKAMLWTNYGEIPGNGIDDDGNGYVDDMNGYDFHNKKADIFDELDGHGTHIAGILAATANNKRGISGVCPTCRPMILKFMDNTGLGYWGDAIQAIEYALANGASITCNAYGTYTPHKGLYEAIKRAGQKGMLFVAAAGNDGVNNDTKPKYPSSYLLSNIISVGSIDRNGKRSWFSNYGKSTTDVAAPGEDIYSLRNGDESYIGYKYDEGTSMAAPIVAGIAAMVWSSEPKQTFRQVKSRILESIKPLPDLPLRHPGTVSAKGALMLVNAAVRAQKQRSSELEGQHANTTCAMEDPCHWNAECTDDTEIGRQCNCKSGFEGDGILWCDDIDECRRSACGTNAHCLNTEGSYKCECLAGHVGDPYKECSTFSLCLFFNPCHAAADCFGGPAFGLPLCVCKKGFEGDGTTACQDVNECAVLNGGCHHECENTVGGFKCTCKEGYKLAADKRQCIDVDECQISNGGCSQLCVNVPGSHSCSCEEGFRLLSDGQSCEDVNECNTANGGCDHKCVNTQGGFLCECDDGFISEDGGATCKDVDECEVDNGGCSQQCVNLPGRLQCKCQSGYELVDEKACQDIDECIVENGGCSHKCENSEGAFRCLCPEGYELTSDGKVCQDIDECGADDNGGCEHTCVNTPGGFECECRQGFELDENWQTCSDVNECLANNGRCSHRCENQLGSYTCSCMNGFTLMDDGHTCVDANCSQPKIRAHTSHVCPEGGSSATNPTCTVECKKGYKLTRNTLKCNANGEWGGEAVCTDVDECLVDNGGCEQICINKPGTYECSCKPGFESTVPPDVSTDNRLVHKNCNDKNECKEDNGGCSQLCTNTVGSRTCGCIEGYKLSDADNTTCLDIDECSLDSSLCHSLSRCVNTDGSYECECLHGYHGDGVDQCHDVDECTGYVVVDSSSPMKRPVGGITVEGNSDGGVASVRGRNSNMKTGAVQVQEPVTCAPNAKCYNTIGSFRCICNSGFQGDGHTCKRSRGFLQRRSGSSNDNSSDMYGPATLFYHDNVPVETPSGRMYYSHSPMASPRSYLPMSSLSIDGELEASPTNGGRVAVYPSGDTSHPEQVVYNQPVVGESSSSTFYSDYDMSHSMRIPSDVSYSQVNSDNHHVSSRDLPWPGGGFLSRRNGGSAGVLRKFGRSSRSLKDRLADPIPKLEEDNVGFGSILPSPIVPANIPYYALVPSPVGAGVPTNNLRWEQMQDRTASVPRPVDGLRVGGTSWGNLSPGWIEGNIDAVGGYDTTALPNPTGQEMWKGLAMNAEEEEKKERVKEGPKNSEGLLSRWRLESSNKKKKEEVSSSSSSIKRRKKKYSLSRSTESTAEMRQHERVAPEWPGLDSSLLSFQTFSPRGEDAASVPPAVSLRAVPFPPRVPRLHVETGGGDTRGGWQAVQSPSGRDLDPVHKYGVEVYKYVCGPLRSRESTWAPGCSEHAVCSVEWIVNGYAARCVCLQGYVGNGFDCRLPVNYNTAMG